MHGFVSLQAQFVKAHLYYKDGIKYEWNFRNIFILFCVKVFHSQFMYFRSIEDKLKSISVYVYAFVSSLSLAFHILKQIKKRFQSHFLAVKDLKRCYYVVKCVLFTNALSAFLSHSAYQLKTNTFFFTNSLLFTFFVRILPKRSFGTKRNILALFIFSQLETFVFCFK